MTPLNPYLYAALKQKFGRVRVVHPGVRRVEVFDGRQFVPQVRGEHYNVDCPLCGDRRQRLSISYQWLEYVPLLRRRRVELAHCYNEQCRVYDASFWEPIAEAVERFKLGLQPLDSSASSTADAEAVHASPTRVRLPDGMTPFAQLPDDHPAVQFVRRKYHPDLMAIWRDPSYGIGFVDAYATSVPTARDRVIFPIWYQGETVGWQGRTIHSDVSPRWYTSPGFAKVVYRGDAVPPHVVPVIAEGIVSALACGPRGVAIFGKTVTAWQAHYIGERWDTVVIATDPETFVPNPTMHGRIDALELKRTLDRHLRLPARLIRWPASVLACAEKKWRGLDDWVPDPADFGPAIMAQLIEEALRGWS